MTDIKMAFDQKTMLFDLQIENGDLKLDTTLETAIYVSLFTDRRANDDDDLPGAQDDKRGWWGNAVGEVTTEEIGSRLWLLSREKNLTSALVKAEEYINEALAWLLTLGVAIKLDITVEQYRKDVLAFYIGIYKTDGSKESYAYTYQWSGYDAIQ